MDLPERKQNRLRGYNYSSAGAYFVTVCTDNRKCYLSEVVLNPDNQSAPPEYVGAIHESPVCRPELIYETAEIRLKPYGKIVEKIINTLSQKYGVRITDYVIMPNHIHMVILIDEERAIRESPLQKRSLISKIVGYLKATVSREIHKFSPDINLWQRDYYDHIIRWDEEYLKIAEYIHTNPGKWEEDKYYKSN